MPTRPWALFPALGERKKEGKQRQEKREERAVEEQGAGSMK